MENQNKLKIIYMGTPGFAVEPLSKLLENGYDIAAVVTAPDKPAGRGRELKPSEVKQFALKHSLPVLQPEKLRDEQFINDLKAYNADLFVVVAFRMLPEAVWGIPPKGTINLHASLLPDYRGAAPINHAIINGEKETGVTTFVISHEIDTGNILLQKRVKIADDETAGGLHDKLMHTGSELLAETVEMIKNNSIQPVPQPDIHDLKPAPKLFRETCEINWDMPAEQIRNLIRGLSPYPGAWSELKNGDKTIQLKIYKATAETGEITEKPGTIITDGKNYLKAACGDGYIFIEEMQVQGKKTMTVKPFLAGFRDIGAYHF